VRVRGLALVLLLALVPAAPAAPEAARWLAGDWHVHTSASHDACGASEAHKIATERRYDACGDGLHTRAFDPAARVREAAARDLDYGRITDHNTMASWSEAASAASRVVLVPGYEHSLPGGHAGITTLDLPARGTLPTPPATVEGFHALMDAVRAAPGGLFVVNHPTDGEGHAWTRPGFDWSRVDAIELWNIHWLFRDEVFRGATRTSENDEALDLWTRLLDEGHRVPIVGGSDSHWVATSGVQGIGQPTTWALADAPAAEAIVEAVRAGRTYVAWDFIAPRLEFTGALPGDVVPAGEPFEFGALVLGAGGDEARVVSCRGVEASARGGNDLVAVRATLTLPAPCWVRVEVATVDDEAGPRHLLYRAISSPAYVR
jgi:hypothetical protein